MVTVAERGNIRMTNDGEFLELALYDGQTHSTSRSNDRNYFTAAFKEQTVFIKNVDTRFERTESGNRGDREMNIAHMMEQIRWFRETNVNFMSERTRLTDSIDAVTSRLEARPAPADSGRAAPNAQLSPADRRNSNRIRQYEIQIEKIDNNRQANELLIAQYMVEVHKKFAIPAACLIFVLIGAPLGIMARRGGLAVGASYSVFFFIIYWVFLITGENMADKLIITPAVGMWAGNVFLVICGTILMILMLRETSIDFGFLKNIKNYFGKSAPFFKRITESWVFRLPGTLMSLPHILLNRVSGKLSAYLMGIFIGYAAGLLAALVVVFITIDYVGTLKRFENATLFQVILYYYYYTPWIAQTMLPIVLFLSSMFSMGRLAKTSELTAMKAAGVSVRQLTLPLLLLGLLLSAGVFYGGEMLIPRANEKRALLQSSFGRPAEETADAPKVIREYRRNFFYFAAPGIMYVFNEFCTEPQFFRGVRRYTFTPGGIAERIDAAEAAFDSNGWSFINGQVRTFSDENGEMRTEKFASLPDGVLTSVPLDLVKRVRSITAMSYWELSNHIEAAKRRGEKVHKFAAELQFKIALPFMNFIVILFGLSLAARTGRRGGAALFGVGLLLSFTYWILSRFALVFAQNGYIPVMVGAWIGNVIFLILGLVLYRKAAH